MIQILDMPNYSVLIGVLCEANKVSDRGPMGAAGHRVFFPHDTLVDAMPTLDGIPLWYEGRQIGTTESGILSEITDEVILKARLEKDMCHEALSEHRGSLALFYEITEVDIADTSADVWEITRCVFTRISVKPAKELA